MENFNGVPILEEIEESGLRIGVERDTSSRRDVSKESLTLPRRGLFFILINAFFYCTTFNLTVVFFFTIFNLTVGPSIVPTADISALQDIEMAPLGDLDIFGQPERGN